MLQLVYFRFDASHTLYIDINNRNFKKWICLYWCCWWRVYDGSKMPHCPMLEVLTPDQSNLATQSAQSTPQYPNKQTRHSSHIIKYKRTSRTFQLKINIASSSGFSICTSELVGWVGQLSLWLPKRRATSRYAHLPLPSSNWVIPSLIVQGLPHI